MLDFNEFINICQTQLQPLLHVKSMSDLAALHQKIKEFAHTATFLFPTEWNEWKTYQELPLVLTDIQKEGQLLLNIIDLYEILPEANSIAIYLDQEVKKYPLLDPLSFVKDNIYDKFNIYFYILLGEILLEDNFDWFQLYGVKLRMTAPTPLASCNDTEQSESE